MSHSNPKRDLATVLERGLDLVLADLEKKKLGKTDKPRRSPGTKHGDFSRQARREIYERDGEQCTPSGITKRVTYVSPSGERCQARAFAQLDHENPRACGGAGTTRNGRLLCRAHNLFEAEKVFGRKYVESRIRLRQQRLDGQSQGVLDESRGADAGVRMTAGRRSVAGVVRLRQQRLDGESQGALEEAAGAADVEGLVERDSGGSVIRLRQQRLDGATRRALEETNTELPATLDPMGCRKSDADEPASNNAPNSDEIVATDAQSRRTSSAGEPASNNALNSDEIVATDTQSRRTSSADEPASNNALNSDEIVATDALSRRTSSAGEPPTPDAPGCRVDDARELCASESLRSLQHVPGGGAELEAEPLEPLGGERYQACVDSVAVESQLISALTHMGFRRGESKRAVASLAYRGDAHSPRAEHLAALLR